jgi:hypothetical protein
MLNFEESVTLGAEILFCDFGTLFELEFQRLLDSTGLSA